MKRLLRMFYLKELEANCLWEDIEQIKKHTNLAWRSNIVIIIDIDIVNVTCKDQFWLEPRTGMDPGLKSPNNKFVESGRKS